jgi:crotonobetainyl-CoA:carnitine CoA-transferase CaiB-like acyl-CoA transferase
VLDGVLAARTTAEWLEILGGAVPCAPVHDLQQALENPFVAERGGVQALDHPDRARLKLVSSPIRMGAQVPARPAPKLGEDTDELLRELGYAPAEIDALRAAGVV